MPLLCNSIDLTCFQWIPLELQILVDSLHTPDMICAAVDKVSSTRKRLTVVNATLKVVQERVVLMASQLRLQARLREHFNGTTSAMAGASPP